MKRILFLIALTMITTKADAQTLVQDLKAWAESVKSNAHIVALGTTLKDVYTVTQKGLETAQEVSDNIGSAVALTLSAQSFIKNSDQVLQCVIPDFNIPNAEFNLTSICAAQDWVRDTLNLPTSSDVQSGANQISGLGGRYSIKSGWTNKVALTSEVYKEKKANREKVYNASVDSALATALAIKEALPKASSASVKIIEDTNAGKSLNQKVSQINKSLADIHAVLVQTNTLLANLLALEASKEKNTQSLLITDSSMEK